MNIVPSPFLFVYGEKDEYFTQKQRPAMQKALDEAVSQERYEDAAKLRDQINALAK